MRERGREEEIHTGEQDCMSVDLRNAPATRETGRGDCRRECEVLDREKCQGNI